MQTLPNFACESAIHNRNGEVLFLQVEVLRFVHLLDDVFFSHDEICCGAYLRLTLFRYLEMPGDCS